MNTREYVKSLFKDYEETGDLNDFMEELEGNLDARIASIVRKGLSEQEAFDKACAELGDVSVLADELSLKKRREVFEEVYMDMRKYLNPGRVAAYVGFGIAVLFGITIALVSYFAVGPGANKETGKIAASGVLLFFIVTAVIGFTFLGLTQETKSSYPMPKKRAAWYSLAAGLIGFGLIIMPIIYFSTRSTGTSHEIMSTIAVLIPFVLPGGGLLAFLALTEKNRLKPWAASFQENAVKQEMELWNDPATASRFGMFSGAIWIFAAALFILFGFLVGFKYSWVVFVFGVAIQLLVQGFMAKKK